jgi:hypothetical protein
MGGKKREKVSFYRRIKNANALYFMKAGLVGMQGKCN